MFVHSLHDRVGEPQYAEGMAARSVPDSARGSIRSGWLRALGNWEGSRSRDGNFKVGTEAFLLQGGVELARWRVATGSDRLHVGAMGSYDNAGSDAHADGNPARAKGSVQGWSIGAYGTWYQNDEHKLGVNADIGKRWSGWANVAGAWGAQSFYQYALRAGVKYAW